MLVYPGLRHVQFPVLSCLAASGIFCGRLIFASHAYCPGPRPFHRSTPPTLTLLRLATKYWNSHLCQREPVDMARLPHRPLPRRPCPPSTCQCLLSMLPTVSVHAIVSSRPRSWTTTAQHRASHVAPISRSLDPLQVIFRLPNVCATEMRIFACLVIPSARF